MFEKILLALDGSESSKKAASVVAEMARKDQSEVVVLHVREREISRGGAYDMETPSESHELVDGIVRTLKDQA